MQQTQVNTEREVHMADLNLRWDAVLHPAASVRDYVPRTYIVLVGHSSAHSMEVPQHGLEALFRVQL